MLRLVREEEKEKLLNRLRKDPSRAMFIIGDIEQNGLHTDYQTTWVEEVEGEYLAVYLKYHKNFVFYLFNDAFEPKHLLDLLKQVRPINCNAAKSHFVQVHPLIRSFVDVREMYFCECSSQDHGVALTDVRKAEISDAEAIARSLDRIVEFNMEPLTIEERTERIRSRFAENKSRGFVVEKDQQVVAYASTAVETGTSAMVASVFCLPEYRGKGYAKQAVWALTEDCLNKGLMPCLFYDNPSAGRIYHSLGYVTFDTWVLAKVEGEIA